MLNIAKRLALRSEHRQHHHACIITKGGKIIATGYNHKYMHAEVDALRKLMPLLYRYRMMPYNKVFVHIERSLKHYTLWSFRWRKNGTWGNALPCKHCQESIVALGIRDVRYTNEKGELVKL